MEERVNIQLILYMIIGLTIVLPIVTYAVYVIDRKDKIKVNIGSSLLFKNSKKNPIYKIYLFVSKFPLSKNYIDKISRRYEMQCPCESKVLAKKTIKVAGLTWLLCAAAMIIIFFLKPTLQNGVMALILVFVINNEVINSFVGNADIKQLEQMVQFVSNVRHNYHINRMVDDAIMISMDGLDYEMKIHANKLYEIVSSNNLKEDVTKYNTMIHNKYMKMFLSLCTSVLEYSDKTVNGQLLFTSNLENLKREINMEILKLKKLNFMFSGTVFVTIAVCLPIDAIQGFGSSIVPDLESFYAGRGGIISVGVIYLSAVMVYILNNKLKDVKRIIPQNYRYLEKIEKTKVIKKALDNYFEKNYGKMLKLKDSLKRIGENISPRQLLIQRMLISSLTMIICIIVVFFMHFKNQYNEIHNINNIESFTSATNTQQTEIIKGNILQYVDKYKKQEVTKEHLIAELTRDNIVNNTLINQEIANEIITRVEKYQAEYFKWYELIVCFVLAFIAYFIPYWMVLYKKKILRMSMEDEVTQFNSIVFMMMYMDHITVKDLLEELELFAVVFKQSIRECLNDYNSGDIEALIKMKENENYEPFRRLVDNLIRCDTISIEKAFDEIASDRENYHDRRKQENEISVQKRADIAKPLSFIPAVLVCTYLVLPLMVASLSILQGISEGLSTLN